MADLSTILVDGQDIDMPAFRAWLTGLDERITNGIDAAALAAALTVVYETRAELDADLAHDAGVVGLVWGDATDANNDLYVKSGASGAGAWDLTTTLHNTLENLATPFTIRAQNAIPFETWAELNAATGMVAGDRATVLSTDVGNHIDPVVGGSVSNSGFYVYSAAPAGWERTADLASATGGTLLESQLIERATASAARHEKAVSRRKNGRRGKIYLTIGQSLSVRRDYTAGQPKVDWSSPHAYMIVGGADRNADADVAVNVTSFNADGADYEALIPFVPGATQGGKIDGFAMMADCPTVCGIYAVGARDYSTLRKGGSSVFVDMSMFLSQAVHLLRDLGVEEIDIIFSLSHGEAETDSLAAGGGPGSPTLPDTYRLYLAEWFFDCAMSSRAALDDPSYEPQFLVHQMGGVFNDPWREIMKATADFADEYANVHLAGPTAPYGFQVDRIHPPGEAQALMGEFDWHLSNRAFAGLPTCLKAHEFRRAGTTITVPTDFFEAGIEVGIVAPHMTDASGFQGAGAKCIYGVEVFMDGGRVDLASVTPTGATVEIELATDPGAPAEELVRFGLMTAPGGNAVVPDATSRCNIRSSWAGIPSRYIPSVTHRAWLLHDEVGKAD